MISWFLKVCFHIQLVPLRLVIKQGVVICKGVVKTANGVFGQDMLWRTRQRGYRAVTLSFSDTYTISNMAMDKVLMEYPSIKALFRKLSVRKIITVGLYNPSVCVCVCVRVCACVCDRLASVVRQRTCAGVSMSTPSAYMQPDM